MIDGLGAHVVTLAFAGDIDAIASRTDLIPEDWQSLLPQTRLSIDYFGGLTVAQPEHLADGGIFDQICTAP